MAARLRRRFVPFDDVGLVVNHVRCSRPHANLPATAITHTPSRKAAGFCAPPVQVIPSALKYRGDSAELAYWQVHSLGGMDNELLPRQAKPRPNQCSQRAQCGPAIRQPTIPVYVEPRGFNMQSVYSRGLRADCLPTARPAACSGCRNSLVFWLPPPTRKLVVLDGPLGPVKELNPPFVLGRRV